MIEVIVEFIIPSHPHYISLSHFIDLDQLPIELLFLLLFVLPGVHLWKTQVFYLFFAHQSVLHPALYVVDLELLTSLRHELVLIETGIISNGVLLTFMKVIQGERALVRGTDSHTRTSICHVCWCKIINNYYSQPLIKVTNSNTHTPQSLKRLFYSKRVIFDHLKGSV